jgi:SAM-dependent methyltransferase
MGHLESLLKRVVSEKQHLLPSLIRRSPVVDELGVREAYRLWASTYATETVTSSLDEELARTMLLGLPQTRLLDAGCGIGRRIENNPHAVGIDLSPEMLAVGRARNVVTGDIRAMPFDSNCFDMIWCRLVLGHLHDPWFSSQTSIQMPPQPGIAVRLATKQVPCMQSNTMFMAIMCSSLLTRACPSSPAATVLLALRFVTSIGVA